MGLLSREKIVAAFDLRIEIVDVPEWGEGAQVGVRVMTGREHAEFTARILAVKEDEPFSQRALLCALTLCDKDGGRLFSQDEMSILETKNAQVLERLYEVACQVNVLREQDREAAKKNAVALGASGLTSPVCSEAAPSPNGSDA